MKKAWLFTMLAAVALGCGRSDPKPLTLEEIPAALSNAFQSAKLLTRQNAESVAKLVAQKKYPAAAMQLQVMMPQELSDQQREVILAALQTLNQALQEMAASASPAAGQPAPPPSGTPQLPKAPSAQATPQEAAAAAAVLTNYIRMK